MNRKDFLSILYSKLKEFRVDEIDEIIDEYQNHFAYKSNDGYTEEEICIRLGDPIYIANQYSMIPMNHKKTRKNILSLLGIYTLDVFGLMFVLVYGAWIISLLGLSFASFGIGGSFIAGISPFNLIPPTPYWCGAVLGVSFIGLMGLGLVGTYYSFRSLGQMMIAYRRFHKNVVNKALVRPLLPSLPNHPQLSRKTSRIMRNVLMISLNIFAISFVIGYMVCALTAESFEFWHVFGWFV